MTDLIDALLKGEDLRYISFYDYPDILMQAKERIKELESECLEQARLNGMGAEREIALRAQLENLRKSLHSS